MLKRCIKCGAEMPDRAIICRNCGRYQDIDNTKKCPNCHKFIDVDVVVCPHCHRVVNEKSNKFGKYFLIAVVLCIIGIIKYKKES